MAEPEQKIGKRIVIHGKVQRVSFRRLVKEYAKECNLFGNVQNVKNYNEDVLITCEGTAKNIDKFTNKLTSLKNNKAESAKFLVKIDDPIEIDDIKHLSNYTDFEIVRGTESDELGKRFDEGVEQIIALRSDFNTLHGSITTIHTKYEKFSTDFDTIAEFLKDNIKLLTVNQVDITKMLKEKK